MILPHRYEFGHYFTRSKTLYNIFKPFIFKIPIKQASKVEEYVKFEKIQIPQMFPEQIVYNWLKSNDKENKQDILSNLGILCMNDKEQLQTIYNNTLNLIDNDIKNKEYNVFKFVYDFDFNSLKNYDIFYQEFTYKLYQELQQFFIINDQLKFDIILKKVLEYKYDPLFFKDCLKAILKLIQEKKNFIIDDIDINESQFQQLCQDIDELDNVFDSINFLHNKLNKNNQDFIYDFLLEFSYLIEYECKSKEHQGFQGLEALDVYLEMINVLNGTSPIVKNKFYQIPLIYNCFMLFENFNIQKLNINDLRFRDFHDHLILRFYTYTNQRSHFPLLIISNNPQYYTKDIHMDIRLNEHDIAIFDFTHMYRFVQLKILDQLERNIFKTNRINMLQRLSGQNPNVLNNLLKLIADNSATANNLEVLIKNKYENIKIEFESKIQYILSHPIVQQEYDQNQYLVWYKILKFLDQINHYKNKGIIYIEQVQYEALLEDPCLKALIDLEILYYEKLTSVLMYQNPLYIIFSEEWVKIQRKKLPLLRRIQYYFWYRFETLNNLQRNKNFYYLTKEILVHYKEQVPHEYQPLIHMKMFKKNVIEGHLEVEYQSSLNNIQNINNKVINQRLYFYLFRFTFQNINLDQCFLSLQNQNFIYIIFYNLYLSLILFIIIYFPQQLFDSLLIIFQVQFH